LLKSAKEKLSIRSNNFNRNFFAIPVAIRAAKKGMTMVIVTHEMKFAREVGTRMIFLDKGEIIENGTPAQVMDHPKTERAKKFFAK
jgi:ABC-type polar amino acid transport system ATPase subunit